MRRRAAALANCSHNSLSIDLIFKSLAKITKTLQKNGQMFQVRHPNETKSLQVTCRNGGFGFLSYHILNSFLNNLNTLYSFSRI